MDNEQQLAVFRDGNETRWVVTNQRVVGTEKAGRIVQLYLRDVRSVEYADSGRGNRNVNIHATFAGDRPVVTIRVADQNEADLVLKALRGAIGP